ncbi:Lipoxygenase [Thozetella sp. PMI_491]|nr:Lipoxygenase [Thozetella sp. PMI_491]
MGDYHHSYIVEKIEKVAEHAAEKVMAAVHRTEELPCPLAHLKCDPCSILKHPSEKEFLSQVLPENIRDAPLPSFDPGVLNNELLAMDLYSTFDPNDPKKIIGPKGNIERGTYTGTQVALTQLYQRIEQTYATYFDVLAVEPTLPRYISLEEKKKIFQFTQNSTTVDGKTARYPPHLEHIPKDDDFNQFQIFSKIGLLETMVILQKVTPNEDGFLGKTKKWLIEKERAVAFGSNPGEGLKVQDVVDYNKHHRRHGTDITNGGNIGLLDDWYSDRRFAEQSFTGTNPVTITRASDKWIEDFIGAARTTGDAKWVIALSQADRASLFVQDCSYFRKAAGVSDPAAEMHNKMQFSDENWAVGAVTLFQLHDDGKLHPVAICIDHKGSMDNSVTIFNKRTKPDDPTDGEKEDWAWRYAKSCAQVSDWMRHELTVHLTLSHFVEEAIIVAANRSLPMEHPVFRLLSPHWYKTLSLNAAARASLVPQVVVEIVGINPDQAFSFIQDAYASYDFQGSYVPNDLRRRGFPGDEAGLDNPKYKNYAYAKNIVPMWNAIRAYVKSMLELYYDQAGGEADAQVAADPYIREWCHEVHTGGQMKTFPDIQTLDQLTDAVTMCIHIAAPFHSTVNYLQNFYQAFVLAKPPSLCQPPPKTLAELQALKEADFVASMPMNRQRQWMLAAQVPWLLSYKVDDDRSLLNYAASQWRVYRYKEDPKDQQIRDISEIFYRELQILQKRFYYNSTGMDKGAIPYMVMDPGLTAVSILI